MTERSESVTRGTTISLVGRKAVEVSPVFRRRIRRAQRQLEEWERSLREVVLEALDAGEPLSGIARAMEIPKQTLDNRVQAWRREEASQ